MLLVNQQARVRAAVAPMQSEARVSSPQTSQAIAGHTVQLIQQIGEWWLVRSADLYEGWMHRGYLEPASGDEHTWRVSLGVTVREPDGRVQAVPVGARISTDAEILRGHSTPAAELRACFPTVASAIVESSVRFYTGASYQWGGLTEWGCDCSGLVQSVFALHGFQLQRDAHQQVSVGGAVDIKTLDAIDTLAESDLLFFSDRDDRRITHVGLMMSAGRMMHSALGRGGVAVEDMRSSDDYVVRLRANFVAARRLL